MVQETDQQPRHWLDRRAALVVQALCGAAAAVFFVGDSIGISRWVLLALFAPTMLGYAITFMRARRSRGDAPLVSKDPEDYHR